MKLLLDANISWRLAKLLQEKGIDCIHVEQTDLSTPATDRSIWQFALAENFIIVTNDEDFLNLSNFYGFPPKVILIKTGNMRTVYLLELIVKHLSSINEFSNSADIGLLEIYTKS
jgi:predicted nuclease of predicted toxin-antitoxin system